MVLRKKSWFFSGMTAALAACIVVIGYPTAFGADAYRAVVQECEKNRLEAFRGLPNLESVREENRLADVLDLSHIKDNKMLQQFILEGYLVAVPFETKTHFVDIHNKKRYAFARPWILSFLWDVGGEVFVEHGVRLKVSGLVRTIKGIRRGEWKTEADCRTPELCSSHTTGATIDISKQNLTVEQIVWLREKLLRLQEKGVVRVLEKCGGHHFHVFVLPTYLEAD